jgi:type II secretory pathway predicted ATPase ExeA
MGGTGRAYKLSRAPIVLKGLAFDCDISQASLAEAAGRSRATINLVLNRGYLPTVAPERIKAAIEGYIAHDIEARRWLAERGLEVPDIWKRAGSEAGRRQPAGTHARGDVTRQRRPFVPGNPHAVNVPTEVEMISEEAKKHFKLFRNPFIDDVRTEADIYMSDEHRYIEMAMLDAARHGGFLAVIGECGSGKSVIRRKVVGELKKDGDVRVIFPQIIDKSRMNASAICDAIVMDLSEEKPKSRLEHKTRQVHKLLLERSKESYRCVLIVEEAHDLNISTLKYLKRFYELEDGFRKLLGIILIGQVELKGFLDEGLHIEMREVIRRIQVAEISGLNGNIKDYLALKFKRVAAKIEDVFTDGAIQAIGARLTKQDRHNRVLSHAYPLVVNNLAARCMNKAYEMGEDKVTEEVVYKA